MSLSANCFVWDLLRSCYNSKMRLSVNGTPQVGKWYWCPREPFYFPWPIAFGSSNWDYDKSFEPLLGEVGHPGRSWWNGGPGSPCVHVELIGTQEEFEFGLSSAQDNAFCYASTGGIQFTGSAVVHTRTQILFKVPGVFAWTVPADCTSALVECWGPGGPINIAGAGGPRGGNGGGAYAASVLTLVPGHTHNVYVGKITNIPNQFPNTSGFDDTAIVLASAGHTTNIATGAAGGQTNACHGDVALQGGRGADSSPSTAGGGGASAGPHGAGDYQAAITTGHGALANPLGDAGGGGWSVTGGPLILGVQPGGGNSGANSVLPLFVAGSVGQVRVTFPPT